jgi:neutral ceramidase
MLTAGVARTRLTPFPGVELTGWGYYLGRTWRRVHDHLHATALALDNGGRRVAVVAIDLMVIDAPFTRRVRRFVQDATGVPGEAILLTCSHSHNAPAAGGLLGVGECDPRYEDWAARQAANAVILALSDMQPVRLAAAGADIPDLTYNRTRDNGPIDPRLTALRVDRLDGSTLAVVVNFGAHPTLHTKRRPFDVSRDVPGEVCDRLETALPGATAMYLQGACGDVNFRPELTSPERCEEPADSHARAALACLAEAEPMPSPRLGACSHTVRLPTRRWTQEEIEQDRNEALRRLEQDDMVGWRETLGRAMTNRPDDMVARHGDERKAVRAMCRFHLEWTSRMLKDYQTRPEHLETEVQALRLGDLTIVANASEFFSSFALDVRARADARELMIACYSNGRIGYLPDAHDIAARSYAAWQSPKYCNQFPFVESSGPAMCEAKLEAIHLAGATSARASS